MNLFGFVSRGDRSPCKAPRRPAERTGHRRAQLEQLESRALLAALPFGAMPDDTGEYMLGDVAVTVVLMESDPALAPSDNLPDPQGINSPVEDWNPSSIAAVKSKIQAGLQWWEDTLDAMPSVLDGLLDFKIDWTYLNNPVHTGYEPIDRPSNDFSLWIYDFLNQVGFNHTGDFSQDIRAYNDFKRQSVGADWGFTIFVVNNENDADGFFNTSGSFRQAFSYAGGRFMVVPASRPASTFAHETGHEFWALDEYLGGSVYTAHRGYYNTQNTNSADNPTPGFVQANSIMANDTPQPKLSNAYAAHTSSKSSEEMIGWKDSDGDGIFDVLDLPLSLSGFGSYDASHGEYTFSGTASVNTLPNKNTSGLQNDITINQIRAIQMSLDNGAWTNVKTNFPARTYATDFSVTVPAPAGNHTVKFRAIDTRTGVTSAEFVGNTAAPESALLAGINGFVYADTNSNGAWDASEVSLPAYTINLLDQNDVPVDLHHVFEPNDFAADTILDNVQAGVTLSSLDEEGAETDVTARTSTLIPAAGKVFGNFTTSGQPTETWTESSRRLKASFSSPVGTVSIRAFNGGVTSTAFARIEAYNAQGQLLDRITSDAIIGSASQTLTIHRAASDIAYVIVQAHAGSSLVLDSLEWGTPASVAIDQHGAYSFPYLPAGTYHVQAKPTQGYTVTTPAGGIASVTIAAGQSVGNVNFGVHVSENIWHNTASPFNVDGDSQNVISPIDALLVINWLNANPTAPQLPQTGSTNGVGYIDVNNDGYCGPIDALLVINYLNTSSGGGGGEGETMSLLALTTTFSSAQTSSSTLGSDSPDGEGEEAVPARTATEYYSRNPVHIQQIQGADEPCTCAQCLAVRDDSLQSYVAASSTGASESDLELIAVDIWQTIAKRRR